MPVDQAWDQVPASQVQDLDGLAGAEADDSPPVDGYGGIQDFAREEVGHPGSGQQQVDRDASACRLEDLGEVVLPGLDGGPPFREGLRAPPPEGLRSSFPSQAGGPCLSLALEGLGPRGREKPKPMRLDHVQLNVSDLLASTTFYRTLLGPLGYEPGAAGEGWQVIQGQEDSLCLVQTDVEHLEPDFHRKRTGLNHLSFRVGTREAFQEYLHVLEQLRVPLLYGGPLEREDQVACYFEDPDRIKIGVVCRLFDS